MVQRALEAATDRLCREAQECAEGRKPGRGGHAGAAPGRCPRSARRGGADVGAWTAGPPATAIRWCCTWTPRRGWRREGLGVAAGEGLSGALEVDHGAVDVSAETSRRIVLRRLRRADASRRRRRGPRRRAQDADRAAVNPPRPSGPRPDLPLPGLHSAPLRCPSRGALGRRRIHQPGQPRAAVPPASPFRPRRRVRIEAAQRRDDDVSAPHWHGARGGSSPAGVAHPARRDRAQT